MEKKEIMKKVLNLAVTIITAILTSLSTTSCVIDVKPAYPVTNVPVFAQNGGDQTPESG